MKIKLWCNQHNKPLRNFEQSNLIFVPSGEEGVLELDLSDYECPGQVWDNTINDYVDCTPNWDVTILDDGSWDVKIKVEVIPESEKRLLDGNR